jgi:hypothetical protein
VFCVTTAADPRRMMAVWLGVTARKSRPGGQARADAVKLPCAAGDALGHTGTLSRRHDERGEVRGSGGDAAVDLDT